MKDLLISILERFTPGEVYLQGTINPDKKYPDSFITFFVTGSSHEDYYDGEADRVDRHVSVMYYSNDPNNVEYVPPTIIRALKEEGFVPQNAGIDLLCDQPTHTGCAMDFIYPEYYI